MIALLKGFLLRHAPRLLGYGAALAAALALLLGARRAGRTAEQIEQLRQGMEIKDEQLRAAARAPRDRDALLGRLRSGGF